MQSVRDLVPDVASDEGPFIYLIVQEPDSKLSQFVRQSAEPLLKGRSLAAADSIL